MYMKDNGQVVIEPVVYAILRQCVVQDYKCS